MTILCALSTGHGIIIGSDTGSVAITGDVGRQLHHGPKFAVHNGWAVGVAGQMRLQCLITRHMEDLTKDLTDPLDFCDRLVNEVFVRYDINAASSIGARDCGSNFVLAGPLGVFDIDCTLSVRQSVEGEMIASGSGASYALGAAFALDCTDIEPVGIVKRAILAAIEFDTGCSGEAWVHRLEATS